MNKDYSIVTSRRISKLSSALPEPRTTEESGSSATFKGITAGSFLPVLVTEVSSATVDSGNLADNDVIALY